MRRLSRLGRLGRRRRRLAGLGSGQVGLEVLKAKRHLLGIELLGTPAEACTLELPDDQAQPLGLDLALVEGPHHVAHQLVQHTDVGRQVVERDPHMRSVSARPRQYKQKGTAYPASIGCRDRTSVRHSKPSKSIESWAGVSVIEAVPSGEGCVDGQVNRPRSSRLANTHIPFWS